MAAGMPTHTPLGDHIKDPAHLLLQPQTPSWFPQLLPNHRLVNGSSACFYALFVVYTRSGTWHVAHYLKLKLDVKLSLWLLFFVKISSAYIILPPPAGRDASSFKASAKCKLSMAP